MECERLEDNELKILRDSVYHMLFEHVSEPGAQELLRDMDKEINIRKDIAEELIDGGDMPDREYAIPNDFYFCLISPLTTYMKSATYDDNFKGHNKKFEIHLVPKALWLRCELVTCIDTDTYFHDLNWIGIEGAGFVAAYPDEDETIQLLISDYTREKTIEEMEKLGFVYKPELTEICENEYK